jgi:hypothetical protein
LVGFGWLGWYVWFGWVGGVRFWVSGGWVVGLNVNGFCYFVRVLMDDSVGGGWWSGVR